MKGWYFHAWLWPFDVNQPRPFRILPTRPKSTLTSLRKRFHLNDLYASSDFLLHPMRDIRRPSHLYGTSRSLSTSPNQERDGEENGLMRDAVDSESGYDTRPTNGSTPHGTQDPIDGERLHNRCELGHRQ